MPGRSLPHPPNGAVCDPTRALPTPETLRDLLVGSQDLLFLVTQRFILPYGSLILSLLSSPTTYIHKATTDITGFKNSRQIANMVLYPRSCDPIIGRKFLILREEKSRRITAHVHIKSEYKSGGGFGSRDLAVSGFGSCGKLLKRCFPPPLLLLRLTVSTFVFLYPSVVSPSLFLLFISYFSIFLFCPIPSSHISSPPDQQALPTSIPFRNCLLPQQFGRSQQLSFRITFRTMRRQLLRSTHDLYHPTTTYGKRFLLSFTSCCSVFLYPSHLIFPCPITTKPASLAFHNCHPPQ